MDLMYHSLIKGGFFSDDPFDHGQPVSIRTNNPGAINIASWVQKLPGYYGDKETTAGNSTVIFETPEHGVAAWYVLLAKYADAGATTLKDVIYRYCGQGREQEAAEYLAMVRKVTDLSPLSKVYLSNDRQLLGIARAFFRMEAGRESPLSDPQILKGFSVGRAYLASQKPPQNPLNPLDPDQGSGRLSGLPGWLKGFLGAK